MAESSAFEANIRRFTFLIRLFDYKVDELRPHDHNRILYRGTEYLMPITRSTAVPITYVPNNCRCKREDCPTSAIVGGQRYVLCGCQNNQDKSIRDKMPFRGWVTFDYAFENIEYKIQFNPRDKSFDRWRATEWPKSLARQKALVGFLRIKADIYHRTTGLKNKLTPRWAELYQTVCVSKLACTFRLRLRFEGME